MKKQTSSQCSFNVFAQCITLHYTQTIFRISQETGWENTSKMTYFLHTVGRKTLTQTHKLHDNLKCVHPKLVNPMEMH